MFKKKEAKEKGIRFDYSFVEILEKKLEELDKKTQAEIHFSDGIKIILTRKDPNEERKKNQKYY